MAMSSTMYLLKVIACIARIAVFIGIFLSLGTKADPVNVTVYYSMVCDHSVAFITQILYPTWKALSGDIVQVDFIQYGNKEIKSMKDESWKQQCTTGLKECDGNKEIACAMDILQLNRTVQMEYVFCRLNSTRSGPECSEKLHMSFDNIKQCKEGEKGLKLVLDLGNKAKSIKPPIKGFPWITFNGVYDRESHMKSWTNFTAVVCKKIEPKPQVCTE